MAGLNQNCMEKLKRKTKTDYIDDLCEIVRLQAGRLTVKELRKLVAKHST